MNDEIGKDILIELRKIREALEELSDIIGNK